MRVRISWCIGFSFANTNICFCNCPALSGRRRTRLKLMHKEAIGRMKREWRGFPSTQLHLCTCQRTPRHHSPRSQLTLQQREGGSTKAGTVQVLKGFKSTFLSLSGIIRFFAFEPAVKKSEDCMPRNWIWREGVRRRGEKGL
jgi:hypothetical protein